MATSHGCKSGYFYHDGINANVPASVCVSDDYYSVYCTIRPNDGSFSLEPYHDVTAKLQRYVSGAWTTIDSWSGRCYDNQDRNITFSNIAKKSASMRVVVTATATGSGTITSPTWTR